MKKIMYAMALASAFTLASCSKNDTACYVFETTTKRVYSYAPNDPVVSTTRTEECDLTEDEAKNKAQEMTTVIVYSNVVKEYVLTSYYKMRK